MASWVVDDRSWISRTVDIGELPRISSASASVVVEEQGDPAAASAAELSDVAGPCENAASSTGLSRATSSSSELRTGSTDDVNVYEAVNAEEPRLYYAKFFHFPGPETASPSPVGVGMGPGSRYRLIVDPWTGETLHVSPRTLSVDRLVFEGPKIHIPKHFKRSSMDNLPSPYERLKEDKISVESLKEDSISVESLSIERRSTSIADRFRNSRLTSAAHRPDVHDRIRVIRRARGRLMRAFCLC